MKFDQVLNVRDFGGQSVGSGKTIAHGKLYRGAQLSKMSVQDAARFQKMGVSLVVDLRYRTERERQPSAWGENHRPEILEFLPELDQDKDIKLAPHERFVLHELEGPSDARRYMLGSYEDRPLKAGFVDMVAKSMRHMSQNGHSIYVHCAAGKDRTGTFAAIILMLLGVSPDEIMEDYMQTAEAVDLDMIIDMVATKMENRYGRPFDRNALQPFFGVEPEYLQKSLNVIGEIEHYIMNVIGLSRSEITEFKAKYTI